MSNVSNIMNMEAVKSDSTVETLTTIQLSYGLPSLVLMISFLILMGCSKTYSNSFYRLVQLDLLTFWTRYYALFGFAFFIYSFLPTLFWFGFANEVSIINGTLSKKRNSETIVKATNVTAVFSVIYFVVILVLGLATSILVKSKVKAIGSASHENIGKKLTRITLIYCFVYTGILMWSVITALNSKMNFLPTFIVGINQNLLVFSSDLAIYGGVCLTFMVFFFFYLGFVKRYNAPFYRIVQLDLFINILCYLNTWIAIRLEQFSACIPFLKALEETCPGLQTIFRYFTNYFMHYQFLSASYMSVHRIMVMKGEIRGKNFWRRCLLVFICFATVYSCSPNLIFYRGFPTKVAIVNGVLSKVRNVEMYNTVLDVTAILSVIYMVIMIGLGVKSVQLVKEFAKYASAGSIAKTLTRVTAAYGFLYCGILAWSVLTSVDNNFSFFPDFVRSKNTILLAFSSDAMTLSLPFILLAFDGNVRGHLLLFHHPPSTFKAVTIMSKKINSNEEEKSIRLVNEAASSLTTTESSIKPTDVGWSEEIVSSVSPSWQVGNVDEKTLALKIPHDQPALGNLRRNFVNVLEFAEDQLEMNRVLAVFEKSRVKATEGFPRTLRYVGFRPYAINNHPASLPADKYFIMRYKV
ncbi:hypothetical protein L3Y34_007049 [Caenorhabditis briggsae]|uniref:Serpentine receptor class gamma n=1 Tax=Caenorhabditis briggsae TaxID=6238 RepID=A0AAE9D0B8_CAEBR|nr:hypothetical protein L3Y34_007049 [Caenorhabditis briggsae]